MHLLKYKPTLLQGLLDEQIYRHFYEIVKIYIQFRYTVLNESDRRTRGAACLPSFHLNLHQTEVAVAVRGQLFSDWPLLFF